MRAGTLKPSPARPLFLTSKRKCRMMQEIHQTYRQRCVTNNNEEMRHSSSTAMLIIVDNIPTTPLPSTACTTPTSCIPSPPTQKNKHNESPSNHRTSYHLGGYTRRLRCRQPRCLCLECSTQKDFRYASQEHQQEECSTEEVTLVGFSYLGTSRSSTKRELA